MGRHRLLATVLIIFSFFLCAAASGSESSDIIQSFDGGGINWSRGIIRSTGMASPTRNLPSDTAAHDLIFENAVKKARENMREIIFRVQVDAVTVVEELIQSNPSILQELDAMIENLPVVEKEYLSDGTVEVTLEFPLYGSFSQLILPDEITQLDSIKPVAPRNEKDPTKDPGGGEAETGGLKEDYTGLVVDALGFTSVPAMSPRILDEKGEQVYGAAYVSREFAVQNGMCGYGNNLKAAREQIRVADNPLTVKGLRTNGPALSDIIISNADASMIRSSSKHLYFLKRCQVMIVLETAEVKPTVSTGTIKQSLEE